MPSRSRPRTNVDDLIERYNKLQIAIRDHVRGDKTLSDEVLLKVIKRAAELRQELVELQVLKPSEK